jgi:myosin heavy subunit
LIICNYHECSLSSPSEEGWTSGTFISAVDTSQYTVRVGSSTLVAHTNDISPRNPEENDLMSDLIGLTFLNEPAVLMSLQSRYNNNLIYTNAGAFLIAMNPFKELPIYSQSYMDHLSIDNADSSSDPHLFSVASACYHRMIHSMSICDKLVDQSIIISGESGSGKTESTRYILAYLTHIASSSSAAANTTEDSAAKHKCIDIDYMDRCAHSDSHFVFFSLRSQVQHIHHAEEHGVHSYTKLIRQCKLSHNHYP